MLEKNLFGSEQISLPMSRSTNYGSKIILSKEGDGYLLREVEEGKPDFLETFESLDEAIVAYRHWAVDISSDVELKEDGSFGYYPQQPVAVEEGPTLFDYFQIA